MKNNKIYGYARVSTVGQKLERQIKNINAWAKENNATLIGVFSESCTGTKMDRAEWQKLTKKVKAGDTIVFDSVSRMSRNAAEGLEEYFKLYDKGVNLVFIKEPLINTESYNDIKENSIAEVGNEIADIYIQATNKVLRLLAEKQIEKAFEQAQKERDDTVNRITEGIKIKRKQTKDEKWGRGLAENNAKGKTFKTKKSAEMKPRIKKMAKEFGGNMTDKEVMETLKLARNTYYKYKKEIMAEQ